MGPEEFELLLQFAPFIIVFVIAGGSILIAYYTQKKRREAIQKEARKRGWEFIAKPTTTEKGLIPSLGAGLLRSVLGVTNIMKRREFGTTWYIFDGSTGSGKSRRTFNVVMAHVEEINLPNFIIKPDTFISNIFETQKDIEIQGQPEFSKKYFVQGSDEHFIQQLFTPELVKYMMDNDVKSPIFCSNNTLMILDSGGFMPSLTKVDKIWKFYDDKKRVLEEYISQAEKIKGLKTF